MQLSPDEVKRFYKVWFALLYYVNQKKKLVPSFPKTWGKTSTRPEDAFPLRNALWEDDALREGFIAENPAALSDDDLALVDSWQYRVSGRFFIFRHLKNYSVFLLEEEETVQGYGVHGLVSSIEEIVGPEVPIYVQTVLLPFEDRIIYDSLLSPFPVLFGGGIRESLNTAYRNIEERGGVITALTASASDGKTDKTSIAARNKKLLIAFQKDLGRAGLTPKMQHDHPSNISWFADSFMLKQKPSRALIDVTLQDIQTYFEGPVGKAHRASMKRFISFLRDTERIDFEQAKEILALLKDG